MATDNSTESTLAKPRWERLGMTRQEYEEAWEATYSTRRRLTVIENHLQEAINFIKGAESDDDVSAQSWTLSVVAKKSLQKAKKKLQKYEPKQMYRDIKSYRRPGERQ